MLYNLYFSNGQPPTRVKPDEVGDWVYTEAEEAAVVGLSPRQTFVNIHGDRWERIR